MERSLYLSKYRNIGFKKNSTSSDERLVLNHSLKKGEMGNLVIVIGANNSGKSNVLDALYELGQGALSDRDITTLSYDNDMKKPKLSLVCKDGDEKFSYTLTHGEGSYINLPEKYNKIKISQEEFSILKDDVTLLKSVFERYVPYQRDLTFFVSKFATILSLLEDKSPNIEQIYNEITLVMQNFNNKRDRGGYYYSNVWDTYIRESKTKTLSKNFGTHISPKDKINDVYANKYNMPFMPQIIKYSEEPITNSMINCMANDIKNNKFFVSIFEKINLDLDTVINTYDAFHAQQNKGALITLQNEINERLSNIADDFNKLYFAEQDKYKFLISLESERIYFTIFRGNKDLSLDYQSTGFKWFFNLYFNLLCKTTLSCGDIIIMDEPATNLHVQGQIQLRSFLKQFALNNDITIVLATHSPFLIDLNCLDELRVVSNDKNISTIHNDFSSIDMNDPDSLRPIKTALTINNHILYDPDKPVVFVEGITDYNYLLAFQEKLHIQNPIVFLPIEGVGNVKEPGNKDKQKAISKELVSIKKHNPTLLVDGDGAGKSMAQVNKDDSNLQVITLADINENFKTIESLFSIDDQKKYNIVQKNGKFIKSSSGSALLKNFISKYEFDKTTLSNFKQVFDYLASL